MIILLIIIVVLVLAGVWAFSQYNGLIKQKNLVQEAWHQVDVELTRRHDLIPNLVNTVQGYAQHESGTLQAVINARNAAMHTSGPSQAAAAEGELSQALGRLMALSEAYPDLKANQNFVALQQELSATEDRIASARRYYNANVRELNTKMETVPTRFFVGMAGVNRADYFEADDAALNAPNVQFGQGGASAAPQVSFDQNAGQIAPPSQVPPPAADEPEHIPTPQEQQAQPATPPQQQTPPATPPQQPYGQ